MYLTICSILNHTFKGDKNKKVREWAGRAAEGRAGVGSRRNNGQTAGAKGPAHLWRLGLGLHRLFSSSGVRESVPPAAAETPSEQTANQTHWPLAFAR